MELFDFGVGIVFEIDIGLRFGRDNRLRKTKSQENGGFADECPCMLRFVLDYGFE